MRIDWIMVLAILAWTLYATIIVTVGRTYLLRMRRARRQLVASRHVQASELPQQLRLPDRTGITPKHSAVAAKNA